MIKIIDTEKPELDKVNMNCDGVINKKLLKYPMTEEAFKTNSFNLVIGRMGSGKTSFVTSLIKNVFKKCFETIYIFMPSSSRMSIEDDIFGKHLKSDQLYDTLTLENLFEVYEKLQANSSEKFNSLLIIDDFQAQLKDKEILKVLEKVITKMRHLRTTIFILQQSYVKCPKFLRGLASNIITFNLGNTQMELLFEENLQINKKYHQQIIDLCFQKPHDWILINLHRNKNIYNNFNLLDIPK